MTVVRTLFLWLLIFVTHSFEFNALIITPGIAGHVIPLFELAKALKNHNVTFITEPYAQSYVNFQSHPNLSSFRLIFTNDSADALIDQKNNEKERVEYFTSHSIFDSMFDLSTATGQIMNRLMNKTVHILMLERYDVIIGSSFIIAINALCNEAMAACVMQNAELFPNMFDMNLPIGYSLLSSQQMTEFKYRIYNVAFTLRLLISILKKNIIVSFYTILQSFPRIPGPFYETFTLRNLLSTKSKCLELISLPPTLYPPSYSHHYTKYLGAFIDESSIDYVETDLTRWTNRNR
ncbi:unnamed protein product [Rotaria sp. Silwood1]|nr:unnamed protein product [Rotaria sp. Silwood1]